MAMEYEAILLREAREKARLTGGMMLPSDQSIMMDVRDSNCKKVPMETGCSEPVLPGIIHLPGGVTIGVSLDNDVAMANADSPVEEELLHRFMLCGELVQEGMEIDQDNAIPSRSLCAVEDLMDVDVVSVWQSPNQRTIRQSSVITVRGL